MFKLEEFINHLKESKINGATQEAIGKAIGKNQAYISQIKKGERPFLNEYLEILSKEYGEENVMQFYCPEAIEVNVNNMPRVNYTSGVPYYNVDFIGGFDLVMNDQTINPEYLIDFKKYNEADYWCNVTGHSMEPEITHGDMIALKEIKDMSFLPLGEVYAIVTTNEMRTIKRLAKGDDRDHYNLVPTNKSPEYDIQEIPKRMIRAIFQVLGCMKRL